MTVPDKPTLDGIEDRWSAHWEETGVYRFDRTASRDGVFSIDTPPPTVSGSIHMGTVFGYTQTDAIARQRRMSGKAVFFPIGWDDNGLATERRVQNFYGVRCDPSQPYAEGFTPPHHGDAPKGHHEIPISRPNFVDLCHELTATDEAVFEALFRRLGLSYDWSLKYETINDVSRRTSQQAFLHNLARGEAYSADAPTVWDVDDRTAVAQAEIEDRERPGAYHLLEFHLDAPPAGWRPPELGGDLPVRHGGDEGASPAASAGRPPGPSGDLPVRHGGDEGASPAASSYVLIDTTRPELLVSCVALVAHPDDERYAGLVGSTVRTPIFGVEVPVVTHPLAQPDKGTGIAMVCTFGDTTDVTWWRELDLPTRSVIGRDGRFDSGEPAWLTSEAGRRAYATLAGLTVKQAQNATVDLLRRSGELHGEPRSITHPVKFYERGSRPLEIVTSRQWYIRNGGREQDRRDAFVARGKELDWYPDHMRHRYDHWVEGLNGDWLVSRQRFFGVPIPLWYPLDADGRIDHDHPIVPAEEALPMDPSSDTPPGYDETQRGQPGGFVGDPDVMDTWATSSLTPQIAGRWVDDADLWQRVFPMDIRPQGPEIIRTWLFSTVVRSHYEHGSLPWRAATINGWILDPDRKKMSKSKGNVVTPAALFDQYGTDAVRYWAIAARPGVDTAFSEDQMKVGRRLATKLLNVTKFVSGIVGDGTTGADPATVTAAVDRAMLARLDEVIGDATTAFDGFDYARALERTESFFWWFCDDYVELVKGRAYGGRSDEGAASAIAALAAALDVLTRLLAPTLPFATEEAWSWSHDTSVHAATWPQPLGFAGSPLDLEPVSEVVGRVRRAKTEAKVSQRAAVTALVVTAPAAALTAVREAADDLCDVLTVASLELVEGPELTVEATLAAPA